MEAKDNSKSLTNEDLLNGLPGYIYAPYVCAPHTKESLKDYDEFMAEYRKKHAVCPKCGATGHLTTLIGYILNSDKRDEYKDLNNCVCTECGDRHTAHERVPNPFKE